MRPIIEILCGSDNKFSGLIANINDKGLSLLSAAGDITYKYVSQEQAGAAYRWANEANSACPPETGESERRSLEIAISIRLHLYDIGSDVQLLGAAIWVKKVIIGSLLRDLFALSSSDNPVLFLTAVRSAFENIGQVVRLHQELLSSVQLDATSVDAQREAVIKCAEVVQKICKGTRIDWETYFGESLFTGRKKSYKPRDGEVNQTAESILNGIDALDRRSKGVRKSYEFLSEFAHPNIGTHNLMIKSADYMTLVDEIRLWTRRYSSGDYTTGIHEFSPQIKETLELLLQCMAHYDKLDRELAAAKHKLFLFAQRVVTRGIRNHPLIFDLRQPCPCFSGKELGKCCGSKIRKIHKKHGLRGR